ncbi:hypothetical protein D9619_002066 [Psilocybe cf. subviscida]|uniref:Uncharacterized protein n=1 Tax=Psilocybe cf. subviscida TaxID=2480587 RepID=A0A8H5BFX0_9AGAR|nr:hypothetical protein D9619_002066 [Psilocybe cf. subviscida]
MRKTHKAAEWALVGNVRDSRDISNVDKTLLFYLLGGAGINNLDLVERFCPPLLTSYLPYLVNRRLHRLYNVIYMADDSQQQCRSNGTLKSRRIQDSHRSDSSGWVNTLSYYSPPSDLIPPLRSLHAQPVHEDRQAHQLNLEGRSISHSLGSPKDGTTLEFPYFASGSTTSTTSLSSETFENDSSLQSNTGFIMRSETRPVTQAPAEHALDIQPDISGLLADSSSTQAQSTPSVHDSELLQPPGSLFKHDFSPLSRHGSTTSEMLLQPALDPVPIVSTVGSVIGGTPDDNTLARYQPHLLDETATVHFPLTGLKGVRFLREAHVINPIPEDKESLQTTNSGTTNAPSNQ